jgi:hypothetical protein
VLAPGGKYLVLSYGEPCDRLAMLQDARYSWSLVEQATVQKQKASFYLYVLQKLPGKEE